ncbi:MAG: glycerophosphodiester phosphodiesterase [Lachnospiraceae bacterium]|nr:glycerophosphodiester phosphodiesterase [Lachnospiraceae bacterium]
MKQPMITAHSGCENTMRDSFDSLLAAEQMGAQAVEVDVRMDYRGCLRLSHDRRSCQEEYDRAVPFASAAAFIVRHHMTINCDVKEPGIIHEIFQVLHRFGVPKEQIWITGGISPLQLLMDPSITETAHVYLNLEEILKYLYLPEIGWSRFDYQKLIQNPWSILSPAMDRFQDYFPDIEFLFHLSKAEGLNLPYRRMDEEKYRLLESAGIHYSLWTVDEEADAHSILERESPWLDNITTRKYQLIRGVLAG